MDKYEFNIKTEQIKKLIRKKEYEKAAEIADTLDFTKIKNNALLITIADVYEVIGQYDSARDVLEIAYERSQLGRQIAFRLTRVSVKRKDLESAIDYYEDFKAIAPKDASCYILQYEISKLKNEPVENQIAILEKYIEDDMDDKWTYELAKLNHDAGNIDRCVELCDTIILWFSEGKYVDKAMELKMLHAPLTKSQQDKYNKRWEEQSEQVDVDDIKLKEVNVDNKYDTYNIQAEIAKSMVELFGEPENNDDEERDALSDTNSFFKPVVEKEEKAEVIEENAEVIGEKAEVIEENAEAIEKKAEAIEKKAEAQSIAEPVVNQIIPEDDKTKVIPSIDVVKELAKAAGLTSVGVQHDENEIKTTNEQVENTEAAQPAPEDDQIEGQITLDELLNGMYKAEPEELGEVEELQEIDVKEVEASENSDEDIEISEENNNEEIDNMGNVDKDSLNNTRELALDVLDEMLEDEEVLEEATDEEEAEDMLEETADDVEDEEATEEADDEAEDEEISEETTDEEEAEDMLEETADDVEDEEATEEADDEAETSEASQENAVDVKTIIRAFIEKYEGVEGLDKQVIKVLQNMLRNNEEQNDFIYIMGDVKSGKTTLAMEIIKLMSKIREKGTKKIAKVNGTSFTENNVDTFASKLGECDVIIERASSIDPFVFSELIENLQNDEIKRIVIFEDERTLSEKYMVENKKIANKIDNVIKLKHNKIKDWAKIAVDYAATQGYTIDEMGMLALHAKIDQLYTITLVIHKNHVEQLVDLAIENSQKKTIGRLIKKLFGNKENENVLTEADFINE